MKKKDSKQVLYLIDCLFADVRTYVDFALNDEIESKDPKIETIKDLSRAKKALDELEELVSMIHLN